jgi:hypothetical protein
MHARIIVVIERHWALGCECGNTAYSGDKGVQLSEIGFAAKALHFINVPPIIRIIHKSAEMHAITLRQMPQQVEGTDLVSLIGGEWYAVHEQ